VTGAQGGQLVFTAEVDVVPAFELPEIDEKLVVEVEPPAVIGLAVDGLEGSEAAAQVLEFLLDVLFGDLRPHPPRAAPDPALRGTKAGEEVTFTSKLKGGEHEGEEAEVTITIKAMKTRELPNCWDSLDWAACFFRSSLSSSMVSNSETI